MGRYLTMGSRQQEKTTRTSTKTKKLERKLKREQRDLLNCCSNIDNTGNDDELIPTVKSSSEILNESLKDLFTKKAAKREKALASIMETFTNSLQRDFVKHNSIALLYSCLISIKSKSNNEIILASRILGLLSLIVGCHDIGVEHEILEDSIPRISQALKFDSDPSSLLCLLESLAIVTFVGEYDPQDTELSMQVIWDFLHHKLEATRESNNQVLIAAISAWSFLLASLNSWSISPKLWNESIPYLFNLLDESDPSVRMVAGETVALILEIGAIEKFSNDYCTYKEGEGRIRMQKLKEKVLQRVKKVLLETNEKGSIDRDLSKSHRTLFYDITGFLKNGKRPEMSVKVGIDVLTISTWSQFIQVNFLKRFLGSGFRRHVEDNKLFHDFFELRPATEQDITEAELYVSDSEEAGIRYVFQPELRKGERLYQRLYVSSNSVLNKAKTQIMNKQRYLSKAKNAGYYSLTLGDENC